MRCSGGPDPDPDHTSVRTTLRGLTRLFSALIVIAGFATGHPDAQQLRPVPFPSPAPPRVEPETDPARDFLFPMQIDWSTQLPDVPVTWPTYDAERAYVSTRSGELFAVSLTGGEILWCSEVDTESPPVMGDRAIFLAGDQAIYALETTIGDRRWRVPVGADFSAPLLWDTGWLVACLEGGDVLALRGDSGEVLWRRNVGSTCRVRPAIGGSSLYVSLDDGRLSALDLTTGEPIWDSQLGDAVTEVLPLGDGVYVGSVDNYFYSLAASNGRIRWRWRAGADIVGTPLADSSRVYFGAMDNVFRALDRRHGAQRWKQDLRMRPIWGPRLIDEIVVLSGLGREIRGYRTEDGAPAGFFLAPSELAAPPHIIAGAVADDRRLYALTGDGLFLSLLHRIDPLLEPMERLPGTPLPAFTTLGVLPGLRLGLPPRVSTALYLPGAVGLPPPLQPVEVHGTRIGHPPAPNDLPGLTIGFPPPLAPATMLGRVLPLPPTPYWFEIRGIELGYPPIPTSLRLPGIQLSFPPPPRDPLPIELPGTKLALPPPAPVIAEVVPPAQL